MLKYIEADDGQLSGHRSYRFMRTLLAGHPGVEVCQAVALSDGNTRCLHIILVPSYLFHYFLFKFRCHLIYFPIFCFLVFTSRLLSFY